MVIKTIGFRIVNLTDISNIIRFFYYFLITSANYRNIRPFSKSKE